LRLRLPTSQKYHANEDEGNAKEIKKSNGIPGDKRKKMKKQRVWTIERKTTKVQNIERL